MCFLLQNLLYFLEMRVTMYITIESQCTCVNFDLNDFICFLCSERKKKEKGKEKKEKRAKERENESESKSRSRSHSANSHDSVNGQ